MLGSVGNVLKYLLKENNNFVLYAQIKQLSKIFPEAHKNLCLQTVNVPSESSVEGKSFHGEEVHDAVCLAVVKQAYLMYRLFHNTFSSLLLFHKGETTSLKQTLEPFFNKVSYISVCSIGLQLFRFRKLDNESKDREQINVYLLKIKFSKKYMVQHLKKIFKKTWRRKLNKKIRELFGELEIVRVISFIYLSQL